jgi:hypothetical protein
MDESRKQFESAIKQKYGDLIDYRVCKNGDGEYMAWDMQVAWWAWQASRISIEVKLPMRKAEHSIHQGVFNSAIDASENAIRAAGLKVKE